ncbi:urease accessory protein [Thalassospira profundimaris]|uniref:HupE/UreJ family protein n=1 Tax=Thalassospira sp. MCCC 1A02491 TaxID=1769751 RepID=UPI0007AD7225|nr:HupE/UreJ family protein [Thalassospira sp. MCCC 1A02491]KZB65991.1 urease accessory protein [Thalassospira sp. MCCC 1A02491]RCK24636.1 urease accessory protein [Thalassospira profundimaris]
MRHSSLVAFAIAVLAATPALAHTGAGTVSGFASGFGHPIGGLDHLLAMVAVGILASQQGGKSVWLLPLSFVGMMTVGGILGVANVALPFVELGIVGSVIVLGAVIALGKHLPTGAAMALVGLFAVFHGHAHGTEMPATASGIEYGIGFAVATAALHAIGLGLGMSVKKLAEKAAPFAVRAGGGAIAAAGVFLLAA